MAQPYDIKYPIEWRNGYLWVYFYGRWRFVYFTQYQRPYVVLRGQRFYLN